MLGAHKYLFAIVLLAAGAISTETYATKLTIGVVQTVIENTLDQNRTKLIRFIDRAKSSRCQLVIFPENALYWADIAIDNPTKADIDTAIEQIKRHADMANLYVVFGTSHKPANNAKYHNKSIVFDPEGNMLLSCWKTKDVPESFEVQGVPCNMVICSDRTFLEYSDLACLVQDSKIIIDISGGHGGDDGRPDLRLIRYRPWATRTNAYVIVSNPVHSSTDFMGHSPWGGGSAIIRPDGSIQASRGYEKDVMIVEEINIDQATLAEAKRRRNHPLFRSFWDTGKELLEEKKIKPIPEIKPYSSAERTIKIAAAQIACSRNLHTNTKRILSRIAQAAEEGSDIVVFPELAVTGAHRDDISAARQSDLNEALGQIRKAAKKGSVYVIVGMPYYLDGVRKNCAFVIGDDGSVKTQYAKIVSKRRDLFAPGESIGTMWFTVKGVHSIVTIGDDADWIEIADLAANRGMYLHFHISYEADASADHATLRKQRNLLMLRYAKYGAVVNAADPSELLNPSLPAHGASIIVSREGGHELASPQGIEYYLPYQTSVIKSAGSVETMFYAARRTARSNDLDLERHHRNRSRKYRPQRGWYDWIKKGARLITEDIPLVVH